MLLILQVATVLLVSIAWGLSLAHALEFPGKLRLGKDAYMAVQPIYYPGFTIGGFLGEFLGIAAILALLIMTGTDSPAFPWVLAALVALVAAQAVYWLMTHPVNAFWLKDEKLGKAGARFFAAGQSGRETSIPAGEGEDWTSLRNRWETSHVLRAVLAGAALLTLTVSVAI